MYLMMTNWYLLQLKWRIKTQQTWWKQWQFFKRSHNQHPCLIHLQTVHLAQSEPLTLTYIIHVLNDKNIVKFLQCVKFTKSTKNVERQFFFYLCVCQKENFTLYFKILVAELNFSWIQYGILFMFYVQIKLNLKNNHVFKTTSLRPPIW